MYPPRWLDRRPAGEAVSRLVFIVRNIAPAVILARFAAGDPDLDVTKGEP
jgi:hypothetical protein